MNLKEYLREVYPKASNKRINHYLTLIENYDIDKLPETSAARRYRVLSTRKKKIEAEMESLKKIIHEQYNNLGHQIGGLNIITTTSRSFDPSLFYNWVSTITTPEILEELTVRTIDETKFSKLEKKGIIKYEELPAEIYTKKEGLRIDIEGSRKRKEK